MKDGEEGTSGWNRLVTGGGNRSSAILADEIRRLGPGEFRLLGAIPAVAAAHWASPTRVVRITDTARDHFLRNRPNTGNHYVAIVEAVRDPDEIHFYPRNARRASFWKRVDETHHLHVAIDMSETADRDNEVVTVIYTRERAIAAGRRRGYRIWGRDEG